MILLSQRSTACPLLRRRRVSSQQHPPLVIFLPSAPPFSRLFYRWFALSPPVFYCFKSPALAIEYRLSVPSITSPTSGRLRVPHRSYPSFLSLHQEYTARKSCSQRQGFRSQVFTIPTEIPVRDAAKLGKRRASADNKAPPEKKIMTVCIVVR